MSWEGNRLELTKSESRFGNLANYMLGNMFQGINHDIMKTFNLYRFFIQHQNTPAEQLQKQITEKGLPIFTVQDILEIQAKIRRHASSKYVQKLIQRGGSAPSAKTPDLTRNNFWDRVIRKAMYPITSNIPPSWDGLLWYVFFLHSLEQIDGIGPIVSTMLDTISLTLPAIPDLLQMIAPRIAGLFPWGNWVGEAIVIVAALIFNTLAVFINIQRKHFGTAFKTAVDTIPFVGDTLAEFLIRFETGADRYEVNRHRILNQIEPVSPTLEHYINYWSPTVDVKTAAPPHWDLPAIKQDVKDYALKESGLDKVEGIFTDPSAMLSSTIDKAQAQVANSVTNATKAVTNTVTKATNTVTNPIKKATNIATSKTPKKSTKGGSRHTRKRK